MKKISWRLEEDYCKLGGVGNFFSNSYIKYENNDDRKATPSIKECLNKTKPQLKNIINNHKKSDPWKILLSIANSFIFSKENDEGRVMHLKSDNIETMINDKADKIKKELSQSLLSRYHTGLEPSKEGNDFIFDFISS